MNQSLAFLGTLGGPEIALIFLIMLLLFGAKKLPQLARGIGKSMGEFKKAREEFEDEIKKGADDLDRKESKDDEPKYTESKDKEPRDS